MKQEPYLVPYLRFSSKWIKDLKLQPGAIKLLEKSIRETLQSVSVGKIFLGKTREAQEIKVEANGLYQAKKVFSAKEKETLSKEKRQPTELEKTFANFTTDKGLIFVVYKKLKKLNKNKII